MVSPIRFSLVDSVWAFTMNTSKARGLTSIIVPCWNQLEFTSQCIAALKKHTRPPWELVVVDNGSTDHTDLYLAGVRDGAAVPVTVISNGTNRGFPAAINQGLKAARGEYLVLLNNDVVVTDAWLDQLTGLANTKTRGRKGIPAEDVEEPRHERSNLTILDFEEEAAKDSTVGLVGPMSNYAAPPQLVESVPYHDLRAMHDFARQWRDEHRGKWFNVAKLSGFCLLMKRVVYETVGGFDERFGIGFFDDDDLAQRARRAGFELAVAHDLFIHHFGSRTFHGNGIDAEKLLDENARRFADKWGLARTNGKPVALGLGSHGRRFSPNRSANSLARSTNVSIEAGNLTQRHEDAKNANGAPSKSSGDVQGRLRANGPITGQAAPGHRAHPLPRLHGFA